MSLAPASPTRKTRSGLGCLVAGIAVPAALAALLVPAAQKARHAARMAQLT